MEGDNKRYRGADVDKPDDQDVQAENGLRRRLISVICGLLTVMHISMGTKSIEPVRQPYAPSIEFDMREICNEDGEVDEVSLPAIKLQRDLWARIIAIDMYCVDSTRKSEQPFWDTYRGCEEDWYKEYRMPLSILSREIEFHFYILVRRIRYSLPGFVIYGAKPLWQH